VGSLGEGFKNTKFLARVMMRGGVKVEISMGGLAVNLVANGTVRLFEKKDIKKGKLVVRFNFLREGNAGVETIEVAVKFF
jgi:hypothetical protein